MVPSTQELQEEVPDHNTPSSSLASMQMNHVLAWFYRPEAPRISLYETDETAIVPVHGLLFPTPRLGSQVRIRLDSEL